jgi:glycosyltransferase involved in cell wall biosynthesis
MKTIVIACTLNHSTVTRYYISIANKLAEGGQRIVIIADLIEAHPFIIDSRITIYRWPSTRPTKWADLFFALRLFIKYRPAAVVAMFSSVNICLLASFLVGIKRRIVWSHTLSTAFNDSSRLIARKRLILKLATEVIVNSDATYADMLQNFEVDAKKLTTFPNAVEDPEISNVPKPFKICYVGRLVPEKGIDLLLEAMPFVIENFPEVKLEIIGGRLGMGKIKHYSEMCGTLGITNHVDFVGMKSRPEVFEHLSKSYFTVMPSFAEGFGLVIIESFAVGTPVIGTNATAIKEIIQHGKDGLLFEPGCKVSLAAAINQLLSNPDLRNQLSVNCKNRFLKYYHLHSVAGDVARYLTE